MSQSSVGVVRTRAAVPTSSRRWPALALTASLGALLLSGCLAGPEVQRAGVPGAAEPGGGQVAVVEPAPVREQAHASADAALVELEGLEVKGRAPMTGYSREAFGQAWLDADRNGCDTRNDVLARDLVEVAVKPGTSDCVVLSGVLDDPYTGQVLDFVRGSGPGVDIDHVVALGNAWATGGFRWDVRRRAAIANDPMNLAAVDASSNRQKGAGDAATWLPPEQGHRCAYVARQVGVKAKYGLWVTPAERAAITRVLARCPDEPVPEDSGAPTSVTHDIRDPREAGQGSDGGTHYANCEAARAAGAAPVQRGDPGYGEHLDRDGDGSACE